MVCVAGYAAQKKTKDKVPPVGLFMKVKGNVGVKRANTDKYLKADLYMPIYIGDMVKTLKDSESELVFDNGLGLKIEENTTFTVEKMDKDGKSTGNSIKLKSGVILTDVKKLSRLQIKTPTATAAVRGTLFAVSASTITNKSEVTVFRGTVTVTSGDQAEEQGVTVTENKKTEVTEKLNPPTTPAEMDEFWAVYKETTALKFELAIEDYRNQIDELCQKRNDYINQVIDQYNNQIDDILQKRKDKLDKMRK
jgi:hypothetical protein